jgi:hypothetical protein
LAEADASRQDVLWQWLKNEACFYVYVDTICRPSVVIARHILKLFGRWLTERLQSHHGQLAI